MVDVGGIVDLDVFKVDVIVFVNGCNFGIGVLRVDILLVGSGSLSVLLIVL